MHVAQGMQSMSGRLSFDSSWEHIGRVGDSNQIYHGVDASADMSLSALKLLFEVQLAAL